MKNISALFLSTAVLVSGAFRLSAKPRLTRKEKLARELREYYVKLDQRLFGERDFKKVERLRRKAERDEMHRPLVIALLAQYQARMERRPVEGLKLLAPEVLGKDKAKQWLRSLKDAESKRKTKYNDAVRQAHFNRKPKPEEPTGLALAFPHQQIQVADLNIDCVLEVARCLMALEDIQPALQIIDKVGSRFEGEGRVLAYECLGDLTLKLSMLGKAVEAYDSGLKLLKHTKPTEGYDEWQKLLLARLQRKLAEAKRRREIELYGPGYVLYRAAEAKRRKQEAYGQAILLYDQLIEKFPKSVWEQAGQCYRIKCRLELAKSEDRPKSLRKAISAAQKKVEEEENFIKLAKKYKVPKATLAEFEAGKAKLEAKVKELKDIPIGKKSLELAEKEAKAFVQANRYGLYRGESMLAMAYHFMVSELTPSKAAPWVEDLVAWNKEVRKVEVSVREYAVPVKAQKVAAAPKHVKFQDRWGNIKWSNPEVGAVVNRQNAPWYLNSIACEAHCLRGLLLVLESKNEEAKAEAEAILRYDPFEKLLNQKKRPNTYRRLSVAFGRGYLIASPKTFAGVPRKLQPLLIVAEYHYEREAWAESEELYRHLMKLRDRMTPAAAACVTNFYGKCLAIRRDFKGAVAIFQEFDKNPSFLKTPSWHQAKMDEAHLTCYTKNYREALKIYDQIIKNAPDVKHRRMAALQKGVTCLAYDDFDGAEALLKKYLKDYGGKDELYDKCARNYLGVLPKLRREEIEKQQRLLRRKENQVE